MNKSTVNIVFMLLGGLLLLFIIAPLVSMFLHTSSVQFSETIHDEQVQKSIFLTLGTAFGATLFFALLAIPLGYFLSRNQFKGKELIRGIVNLPVVIPHSAAGIAILGFISRDTLIGNMAGSVGLNLVGHPIGISLAMAFVSVPFLLNAVVDGFDNVPERLEKAALNLGASPIRVFFTISLPLAWRNVVSGFVMMFARGMSEFGAVVIVAYHPMIVPVMIYERFSSFGLKYARPVSVVFICVSLIFFIALRLVSIRKKNVSNAK